MLDPILNPLLKPHLEKAVPYLNQYNLKPWQLTAGGFGIGIVGCVLIGMQLYIPGFIFLLLFRLADMLDGIFARANNTMNDIGAYFDLNASTIIYAAVPFFFAIGQTEHMLAAMILILSYIIMASTSLSYNLFATKRGLSDPEAGKRPYYKSSGIVGHTEHIAFIGLVCFAPLAFSALAFFFAIACWADVIQKVWSALRDFGDEDRAPVVEENENSEEN